MRSDFERGAYNVEEHNHIEWPTSRLEARISHLNEMNELVHYSGERLAQVEREIGLCALELSCRYADETNKSWEEYNGTLDT